jgi:hypothetical protein
MPEPRLLLDTLQASPQKIALHRLLADLFIPEQRCGSHRPISGPAWRTPGNEYLSLCITK